MATAAEAGCQVHGGKFWEKRRRDRLKDSFCKLARLLPNHDPSKLPSQNDILIQATEFVSELRLSNLRLLSDTDDEKSKLIMQLQDEVNKLIVRVKQLTQLLRKAKIVIPTGPEILGTRKRPGDKDTDAENAKKTRLGCSASPSSASDDNTGADDVLEITGIQDNSRSIVPVPPLRDSNTNTNRKAKPKSPKKTPKKTNGSANPQPGHIVSSTTVSGITMTLPPVSTATSVPLQIPLRSLSLPTFITIPQPCLTILPQQISVTDKSSSQPILPKPLVSVPCPRVAITRLANTRPPKAKFKRNRKKKVRILMTRTDAQIQTQDPAEVAEAPAAELEKTSSSTESQTNMPESSCSIAEKENASHGTGKSTEITNDGSLGAPAASSSEKDIGGFSGSSVDLDEPIARKSELNLPVGPESVVNDNESTVVREVQPEDLCEMNSRIEEKQLQPLETQPQKVHEFMSDTFNDIEEILMPRTQKEHQSSSQPSVIAEPAQNDTHERPEATDQLSSEKISECIARSMDLIDQSGPDLMDLSGDWPNTSSPKSPLSPTKMFLSMFPLALRENPPVGTSSTAVPEVSSTNVKISATVPSTAKSSFHIDSMLPTEEMSGRTSTCNTPLPMVVPGMISHQPSSLHSLSTDDYLSMVTSFVSGTGTKSSTFDPFSLGLAGDLEGTEVSNPFSFSLNLTNFEPPSEQLTGGAKYIADQQRSRPDKRSLTALAPSILDSGHQTATPTNFSFTLSNTGSYAASSSSTNLEVEPRKKSNPSRHAANVQSVHHADQRQQLPVGASQRHSGQQSQSQSQQQQRSIKHQNNPMQFTISDLMSSSSQQVSSSSMRQNPVGQANQGTTKADSCQYKPYENPLGNTAAASQQFFSQPATNQPMPSSHPQQQHTNLLSSFNSKNLLPNVPSVEPNSRQQKQSKSTKPTKSGDQASRSQPGPLRSYRTLSDSVVDITRKSSETWSSSSYRYYDTGYSAGSAQPYGPNISASNANNDARVSRNPASKASGPRPSEAAAKSSKANDKSKSTNTKGSKASAGSARRTSAEPSQQMQLPLLGPPETGGQNAHLLHLRPPPVLHQPSEGFLDMGNGRNSFGFFDTGPNRIQYGSDSMPLPQPNHQPMDKPRMGPAFGDSMNVMQNTFQQPHPVESSKAKQMSSQSRQSSKSVHMENTSSSTRNTAVTSTSVYGAAGNQSQPSSNKKKSSEPPTSVMHHPSSQTSGGQQQEQPNQFHGSYNQSGNMWSYDQPKVQSMRSTANQPSYQKSANAFSVSKLVGNVESHQQQQQPRHFVEGLLGKNPPNVAPWGMSNVVDSNHPTNVSDQGFGYYQQPEGNVDYFNYNPTYHQPSPQVSNNSQNFSNDPRRSHQVAHAKSTSHASEVNHYPSYPSSSNQQQQQNDRNRHNNEVQQFPRFPHHSSTKLEQHSAATNQTSAHQQMQQQQQHHQGTSSVSNFNLSSIFPEVNQDIASRPHQHQQHLNMQSHGNTHQRNTSGHFYR